MISIAPQLSDAEVAAIWAATEKEIPDEEVPEALRVYSGPPKREAIGEKPGGVKQQRAGRPRAVG